MTRDVAERGAHEPAVEPDARDFMSLPFED
jgi:hypothetical protein